MSISTIQSPPPRSAPVMQGEVFQQVWSGWFRRLVSTLNGNLIAGFSGTVVLTKLTTGGTNGSLTVVNGIITAYAAPT